MTLRRPIGWLLLGAALSTMVGAQAPEAGPVTFSRHVAPILFERCGMCHHPDGFAPFSLLTYDAARRRATQIAAVTSSRVMPPWKAEPGYGEFAGQQPLTDAEIALIQRWVADGAPEGDRRALPGVPWSEGWRLGTPDLVVTLQQPYVLRAGGQDFSRVFVLPVPVTTLRYVRGLEFRAGSSRAVHHANIRLDRTRASRQLDEADPDPGYEGLILRSAGYPDGHFLGWTPGQSAPLLPPDLTWRLHPGSDLVVEMHLVPGGRDEIVAPSIGLYFGDQPPARTPTTLRLGRQSLDIPAGEGRYVSTDAFVLPVDVEVHAVQPHAHHRAREISGLATLPDGTTRWLLFIKDWDFRWQHVYRYVEPIALPRGTAISMRYTYDNSAGNPRNPQLPPVRVRWGQQSTREMGDLWIQVLTRNDRDRQALLDAFEPKLVAEDIVGYEVMIEDAPSKVTLRDDVAVLYMLQGLPGKAAGHLEVSAAQRPESAAAQYNLGTALAAAGRLEESAGRYRAALRLRPDYAVAHNNLGNVLVRLGRLAEAFERFEDAVRLDPLNAEAHYNAGSLALARGDLRQAIERFRRAAGLEPGWAPPPAALAWLLATALPPW